jgi:ferritin-like protein
MLRLRQDAREPGERDQLVYEFQDPLLELVRLLREATEVEHALLVQYLYAAFSVKPRYQRIVGSAFPATANNLLGVAVQEMQHLDQVNRMLLAVGASPNLIRQDFPYEPAIYPFAFNLEPMSRASLAKYVWTEAPANDPFLAQLEPVLGELHPNHLGSLYATIIAETEKLIADPPSPDVDLTPWPAKLEFIKGEGEVAHFAFFKELFLGTHAGFGGVADVWDLAKDDERYPSLDLQVNPTSFVALPNTIVHETSAAIAWLSDLHYWITLVLLDVAYRHGSATAMALAKSHMTGPLIMLGRHLATRGCGMPFDPLSVGYNLGRDLEATKRLLGRLLAEAQAETEALRADLPATFAFAQTPMTISKLSQL